MEPRISLARSMKRNGLRCGRTPKRVIALCHKCQAWSRPPKSSCAMKSDMTGTGYPRGLKGEQLSLGTRLFALIDTLDAMTSDRSYRKALPFDQALAKTVRMNGIQFDPLAIQAFLAEETTLREMVEAKCFLATIPSSKPTTMKGIGHDCH